MTESTQPDIGEEMVLHRVVSNGSGLDASDGTDSTKLLEPANLSGTCSINEDCPDLLAKDQRRGR